MYFHSRSMRISFISKVIRVHKATTVTNVNIPFLYSWVTFTYFHSLSTVPCDIDSFTIQVSSFATTTAASFTIQINLSDSSILIFLWIIKSTIFNKWRIHKTAWVSGLATTTAASFTIHRDILSSPLALLTFSPCFHLHVGLPNQNDSSILIFL